MLIFTPAVMFEMPDFTDQGIIGDQAVQQV
jgi:hypothetical protein